MCLPITDQPAIGDTVTVATQLGHVEGEVTAIRTIADVSGPRVELTIDDRIRAYGTALVD